MKCQTCGAIVAATADSCEFCGTSLEIAATKVPVTTMELAKEPHAVTPNLNAKINKKISFAEDSFNLITELNETEKNQFNWLAFFFPIAFLAGYGSKESAKKIAAVILIPVFLMSIVRYFSFSLASMVSAATLIWTIYVYYLVSTRHDKMTKKDKPFNMGTAIFYEIAFVICYGVLQSL